MTAVEEGVGGVEPAVVVAAEVVTLVVGFPGVVVAEVEEPGPAVVAEVVAEEVAGETTEESAE